MATVGATSWSGPAAAGISSATVVYGKTAMGDVDASALTAGQGFSIGGGEGLGIDAVACADMNGDGHAEVVLIHPQMMDNGGWAGSIVRGASTNASIQYLGNASRTRVLRIRRRRMASVGR